MKDCKMGTINFIIQSVEGIGKTFLANKLGEYFKDDFQYFPLFNTENAIDQIGLDKIIKSTAARNQNVIIDTQAENFSEALQFISQASTQSSFSQNGIEGFIHVIIAGDKYQDETLTGLFTICKAATENVKIIVWLNEYFGKIEGDGKEFQDFKIYKNNRDKIHKVCKLEGLKFDGNGDRKYEDLAEQLDAIFPKTLVPESGNTSPIKPNIFNSEISNNNAGIDLTNNIAKLYEEALANYKEELNSIFEKHLNQSSALNALHLSEASNRAEIVITQAAEYLTQRMQQAAEEISASTSNMLAEHIAEANKAARQAKLARNIAIIALAITIAFLIGGVFGKFL